MKRLGLLLVCFATLALTSCDALSSASSSNSVAKAAGQTCGSAVQGLFRTYRNTGTIDMTNGTNINNALALATAYTNLKNNRGDNNYRKAFTSGLIASSAGLITSSNAEAFVDRLLASSGLSNLNTQNISQSVSTAAAIVNLVQMFN